MRTWKIACSVALLAVGGLLCATVSRAQEPPPKPGPEHELLKKYVGVWDVTIEGEPGSQSSSKGSEHCRLLAGGLWLVTEFKGDLMGQAFEGTGMTGYDPIKKKYVDSWVDSMSTAITRGESTYDPATKTMTGIEESTDPSGKPMKMKSVTEWKDDNTRIFTMSFEGPDGKFVPALKIKYTRRAGAAEKRSN